MARMIGGVQAVTANRLTDGVVVWLDTDDRWVERFEVAAVFEGAAAAAALGRAQQAQRACVVVEPYLIEVSLEGDRLQPARYREQIRALGPSVRPDLGKQAAGAA